jgi:type 1 glutamine amidotransferase
MRLAVRRFRRVVYRLQWVHQGIGVLGGLTFLIGSIFFLYEDPWRKVGTWLFIIGSAGMFIGNLGSVIVRYEIQKSGRRRPVARGYVEPIG